MNEFSDIETNRPLLKKGGEVSGRVRIDPSSRSVDHGQKTSTEVDCVIDLVRSSSEKKNQDASNEIQRENQRAQIRFDMEDNGHVVLNIVDPTTQKVIQRIPPKSVFDELRKQGVIKLKSFLLDVKS